MVQGQVKTKRLESSPVSSYEVVPIEIVQLLNVLARIEIRRQAKLRVIRKEVN
jgi:hypothetical protein